MMATITIYTLWIYNGYDGVPELLVAVDEFTMDGNPDFWEDECAKMRDSYGPEKEYRVVQLTVPYDAIGKLFLGTKIAAEVESDE